ncbi:DUF1295 domain-containing protein, partial [Listeria monocytogenes]|uniref:DUF1295 domain-containing protein n=1 Tax=Listeria monocytogenes TaxID=1639 RepID=UPI001A8F77AB
YWTVALALLVYFILRFIISKIKGNYSLVDIAWGGGFVVVAWTGFLSTFSMTAQSITLLVLVTIRGVRLFWHLARRNW